MVTTTSKYIGDVAGSASDTLVDEFDHGGTFLAHDFSGSKHPTGDLLSCRNYLHELHVLNQKAAAIDNKSRDTVLTAMNTMWRRRRCASTRAPSTAPARTPTRSSAACPNTAPA